MRARTLELLKDGNTRIFFECVWEVCKEDNSNNRESGRWMGYMSVICDFIESESIVDWQKGKSLDDYISVIESL